MKRIQGIAISLDGTDGSGKETQATKITQRLSTEGYHVRSMSFPQYENNFFGKFLGECLRGDYGDWLNLHPKIASVIYAADRFGSSKQIQSWLDQGDIVIFDRFTSSNQIHQGGKIHDEKQRVGFMHWLSEMEHEAFKIPRPDIILYLDVPAEINLELLKKKEAQDSKGYLQGKKDQHESSIEHLTAARESGLKMVQESPNAYRIECVKDGVLLSIETIHEMIYEKIKNILNN